ncbi:MAG: DNA-directed RNA polymerase [Candidatus Diapherotrites archaeon]|uniref:DNA-directed RNA polymerase subunit Rpo7 n=1 Tax=Candidatus Iainarchaeum sp. TaxID=3101447 RepID=A0A8T3YPR0_9ARCH|nr:DNA-directed RNA polymerase [Candidatus Diapherotrites archaeon]
MYIGYTVRDTVRVPPADIGGELKGVLLAQARKAYEGALDEDTGVVIAVTGVGNVGDGRIVPGDGAAYYEADISFLAYKPKIGEIVEGEISDVTEFGAFIKTGPLEGLIHVSQIMDDYINYDAKLPGFSGKETAKKLIVKDTVLARIVTVSLKGTISSSKVGLTMRQPGLGKPEWPRIDDKEKARKAPRMERKQGDKKPAKDRGEKQ